MIKLIIFDIGGVLIDFGEDMYTTYISKKLHIDKKEFSRAVMHYLPYMELGDGSIGAVLKKLAEEFGTSAHSLEWAKAFNMLAKPNKDVIAIANKLSRSYNVVLLTNVSLSRYRAMRRMLNGIANERIFPSCYLHMRKPSKRIYLYVLRAMHAKPNNAIFIDNLAENVAGARKAGIDALRFTTYTKLVVDLKKRRVVV